MITAAGVPQPAPYGSERRVLGDEFKAADFAELAAALIAESALTCVAACTCTGVPARSFGDEVTSTYGGVNEIMKDLISRKL